MSTGAEFSTKQELVSGLTIGSSLSQVGRRSSMDRHRRSSSLFHYLHPHLHFYQKTLLSVGALIVNSHFDFAHQMEPLSVWSRIFQIEKGLDFPPKVWRNFTLFSSCVTLFKRKALAFLISLTPVFCCFPTQVNTWNYARPIHVPEVTSKINSTILRKVWSCQR